MKMYDLVKSIPGLVPGMEQPLPMSGCLNPDQFPLPTSISDSKAMSAMSAMPDMPFNMSAKAMSDGPFNMSMDMSRLQQDMVVHQQDFASTSGPGKSSRTLLTELKLL